MKRSGKTRGMLLLVTTRGMLVCFFACKGTISVRSNSCSMFLSDLV